MTASFAQSELSQALSEIPWGIRAARLRSAQFCPPGEAQAEVDLLEGGTTLVACSQQHWRVVEEQGMQSFSPDVLSRSFDTLDDILLAISPLFEQKRMEVLMSKLGALVERQSDPKDNEPDANDMVGGQKTD
ncbi:hypothetical protein JCM1840_001619 [Sporobolomyces johnsonii]